MESGEFGSSGGCGEEIERALMDLGPLLGVSIKEEVPDDSADGVASLRTNVSSNHDGAEGNSGADGSGKGDGADSLPSPATRTSFISIKCVFCHGILSQTEGTPKLMECLHSACELCVKTKVEEKLAGSRDFLGAGRVTIQCAACRLQCQPNNMIDQRFVVEKVSVEQVGNTGGSGGEQQCNSCEDTEPANSYCVDCAEFICDNCVQAHQRLKITKDHTIKVKEEALAELQAAQGGRTENHDMFCRDHPQERLSLFCETCDRLTCRDCQLQHHRDHKYQFSTEMAAQARASIAALVSEVSYKRVLLGSAMKVIRDRQHLIADKKKALVHEITQTVVKLTNAINTRGKQLVLRLNEVCDGKQRTLGEKKEALEQLAAITDHCLDFVGAALEQGSDTAVLYSKRAVCAHLQRIKSRRADIPNPEIPVRITLALDKLPELIRVLSTIGGIVVDGKVDGGSPSPGSTAAPVPVAAATGVPAVVAPYQTAPHSAVLALQQVAMHQSYVAAVSGVGGANNAYMGMTRSRAHTPLRQPHVTSTTHPHHLHGVNELNLRGLLNASGRGSGSAPARALPPPPPHAQNVHSAFQHMMGAYGNMAFPANSTASGASGRRSGGPRTPSPAPPAPHYASHTPPAKWHIPQHGHNAEGAVSGSAGAIPGGADFKIQLGRPHSTPTVNRNPVVTSTNPKTPSPSLNGGVSSELDKVCAESVQDLMATIAKLDSNGVQVVPERASPAAPLIASLPASASAIASPELVHSSTGAAPADPNEDWCAVCMDGGELMCCDKCPKVFHQYCHIPAVEKLPEETESWQCLLCINFAAPGEEGGEAVNTGELVGRQRRIVERITLELYCQLELSLPFREPQPARPMCLDMIRCKLQPRADGRYTHEAQFVADVRLLFRNVYRYKPPDSQLYKDAKRLEEFFDAQLLKWMPEYAYWSGEGEPPAKRSRLE
ncbi:unnamed protein product [Leptosia nina]|uniref:E3 ubiquitin-protein ligase TRIM33 n=1 Tax=Leptosia nina TaxID=320188 RepID=A0AAV1J085_9NEOP